MAYTPNDEPTVASSLQGRAFGKACLSTRFRTPLLSLLRALTFIVVFAIFTVDGARRSLTSQALAQQTSAMSETEAADRAVASFRNIKVYLGWSTRGSDDASVREVIGMLGRMNEL